MFEFSAERDELRDTVRAFLARHGTDADLRRLAEADPGYDPAVWRTMATQLALPGLGIPEELGGVGGTMVDLQIVLEEMGRALLCAPYLSSVVLAAGALLASGDDDACAAYLPGIAAGTTLATLAHLPGTVTARGSLLSGTQPFVLDGATADLLLVAAGRGLYAVAADASGVTRTALSTLDHTRRQATVSFVDTPARLVGAAGPILRTARRRATVALAAEQVGSMRRMLEMSVAYASRRVQFGRVIGAYQAIKHKVSDMLIATELSASAAYGAGFALDLGAPDADELAEVAGAFCGQSLSDIADETIQVHGGIGFTWEHPAHFYFKRAKSSALLFGTPRTHRAALGGVR